MNWNNANLEAVTSSKNGYPKNILPEIALFGRSNVGKSSFINKILNRRNLARTSSTPGKTATINFYNIDDKVRLVDLPGYGYAKRTESEKKKWTKMIEEYLTSGRICTAFQVVDLRHKPSADDITMNDWVLQNNLSRRIIATKWDKVKKSDLVNNANVIEEILGSSCLFFSADTGLGVDEVKAYVEANIARP